MSWTIEVEICGHGLLSIVERHVQLGSIQLHQLKDEVTLKFMLGATSESFLWTERFDMYTDSICVCVHHLVLVLDARISQRAAELFSLLAAGVGEEAGEGPELGPEEDLHHGEIGEETAAEAGCESSQEPGCLPHFCKAHV